MPTGRRSHTTAVAGERRHGRPPENPQTADRTAILHTYIPSVHLPRSMTQGALGGWWRRIAGRRLDSPLVLLAILVVGGLVTAVGSVLLLGATLAATAGMNPRWQFVALLAVLAVTVTIPVFLVGRSRPLVEL